MQPPLQKSESPAATELHADQTKNFTGNFASSVPSRKEELRMQALFALAGHEMVIGTSGDYNVGRWGMWRYCQDWNALNAFADLVGVKHAA